MDQSQEQLWTRRHLLCTVRQSKLSTKPRALRVPQLHLGLAHLLSRSCCQDSTLFQYRGKDSEKEVIKDIEVLVNQNRTLDFVLAPSALQQSVEVSAAPAALETTTGTLGKVLEDAQKDIPPGWFT
jgi:hypothetical protein